MIVYDHNSWLGSLLRLQGTVTCGIFIPVLCVGIWSYVIQIIATIYPPICDLSGDVTSTHKMLGTFVSFFLIFRTNQAYQRYWHCNETLKLIMIGARELHAQFLVYIKGGRNVKSDPDKFELFESIAGQAKQDAVRYILAYCTAFKLHTRIAYTGYHEGEIDEEEKEQVDFDRARLRGLLTAEEFSIIDNVLRVCDEPLIRGEAYPVSTEVACRACHVMIFFLRSLCGRVSAASHDWGWFERCLNLVDVGIAGLMRAFEEMDQNITTPLPLPYCHLCKWLMFLYLFFYPIACHVPHQGMLVNTVTAMIIGVAMCGIEAISMEIEDPFGDDDNDFDVMRIISGIEDSIYEAMLMKDGDPAAWGWIQSPAAYRHCERFMVLQSEASAVLARMPGAYLEKPGVHPTPTQKALKLLGEYTADGQAPDGHFRTGHSWARLTKAESSNEVRWPLGLDSNGELCAWRPSW